MPKKTFSAETPNGPVVTGTGTKTKKQKGPAKTPNEMNKEILDEKVTGAKRLNQERNSSWRKPNDPNVFLSGQDAGILSWLTPVLCHFFDLADCGYKNLLSIWNFPPDVDDPKKKHKVTRQYYYQIDGKYLLVDVFDTGTSIAKITLIKAWMEALGYRYTYILGGDWDKGPDSKKFLNMVFKDRLKMLDPKGKDYPKFKIPTTFQEANLEYGGHAIYQS